MRTDISVKVEGFVTNLAREEKSAIYVVNFNLVKEIDDLTVKYCSVYLDAGPIDECAFLPAANSLKISAIALLTYKYLRSRGEKFTVSRHYESYDFDNAGLNLVNEGTEYEIYELPTEDV
jgi:hypothetical protein